MTSATTFSLARRLRAGETVHSGWCGLPYPIVAELVGREGFPAVALDAQHGLWDTASMLTAIAQVHLAGAAPIVRIPVGAFATASRALDFGAEGIIAPMINTPEDARTCVSFVKFPPLGERSWGPHRATTIARMPDQKVYLREANALTVTFAMIETRTALDNVEAIAATPGIDALFLGPADLSIALSNGADVDPTAAQVDREIDRITAAATEAGRIMGAYCHGAERGTERRLLFARDDHRADDRDGRDRVGERHERRVQQPRDVLNDLKSDEGGEQEHECHRPQVERGHGESLQRQYAAMLR